MRRIALLTFVALAALVVVGALVDLGRGRRPLLVAPRTPAFV
jgi:hypothetical protein